MVSSDKTADHKVSSDKLLQSLSSHSDSTVSQETFDNKTDSSEPDGARSSPSVVAKKEMQVSDATAGALQSDQEGSARTSPPQKPLPSPNTVQHALESGQESPSIIRECSKDIVAEKEVQHSDSTTYAQQLDQQGSTRPSPPEKPLQNPNTASRSLQAGQDSPSIIGGKVSKAGYNWRKYGQKHVKGNEFIRSYYKCTHPNCQAKKQLEQSNDGQIIDTIFIGQHNHPQVNTPAPVDGFVAVIQERPNKSSLVNVEDKVSIEHGIVRQHIKPLEAFPISTFSTSNESKAAHLQSTRTRDAVLANEDPESKRLKKDNSNADVTGVEKSIGESRVVVHTSSEVDFINDGYRWRKYGQKLVKGNPNPRSYYRCSSPGCPVKKHVERDSHDQKIVITTYEGHHDHDSPSGRAVIHDGAAKTPTRNINSDSGTKARGNSVCVNTTPTCLDSESRLNEQPNGEKIAKPNSRDMVESQVISHRSEVPGNTSSEKEKNGYSGTQKHSVSLDVISHSDSEHPCRLNEQQENEVRTTSEEGKDESKLNKRLEADAEPVQS